MLLILAVAGSAFAGRDNAAKSGSKISTPGITCGGSSFISNSTTQASLNVTVTAGASGLPAGFSVQWMTAADYAAYGWPADSDCTLGGCAPSFCKASFSGNASGYVYNIPAFASSTVTIGEELTDNGASTSCPGALACGTDYVFRAFGHATNSQQRSDFTGNTTCSTIACHADPGCTLTQGYWKTHNDGVCLIDSSSPLCVAWPVSGLTLGTVAYTNAQLVTILNTPAAGDNLLSLAHQLIAAKLNVAHGADPTAVAQTIADADTFIGGMAVGVNPLPKSLNGAASALTSALTAYNEGSTGPGHCQ
jgi:hypothetical protein